ncbi:glycerophosphoryl diester phosphodiesterase membrane domain-containing protein [Sphingomonas lutea]|uniref:Glycerophosphoryl diester phosphodiesterase membrane domain-containing protein n=1 Tax=Sphingomonas lutea TaxID=1045317 RepID=A0A7G9SGE6_9SPHN|nr:glycerophosphoryl diester phosphodiesterase membrane domain-containing protein [Sphingomonas lutea]QNN66921.1 glycerophosphoryl diester phosphodiesterase membrane domain-containing protein [Sphingomonas lutea]
MKRLSLSKAWEDCRGAVIRNGRLLAAVALALMALPGTVQGLVTPDATPGQLPPAGPWIAIAGVATLLGIVGQLAIIRLLAAPGTSVKEAIAHGVRRLLTLLAAVLLWLLPLAAIMVALGESMTRGQPSLGVSLAIIILFVVIILAVVRMIVLPAVVSEEPIGPIAAIRRSWQLTRGSWWRLFAFLMLFLIAALCVLLAVELVFGSVVAAAFGPSEPMSLTRLLTALVTQVVTSLLLIFYLGMLGRIYAQLAGASAQVSVPSSGT